MKVHRENVQISCKILKYIIIQSTYTEICLNSKQQNSKPNFELIQEITQDFAGGPVVRTSPSNKRCVGSIPGWGTKIPYALPPKNKQTNRKQNQYCNKFNKALKKMVHIKKKILKKNTHSTLPRSWIVSHQGLLVPKRKTAIISQ